MVNKIYGLKNRIIQRIENEVVDINRIDVTEVGELVDMVKDLAQAECYCMKAKYYDTVTKAMNDDSGLEKLEYVSRDKNVQVEDMKTDEDKAIEMIEKVMSSADVDKRKRFRNTVLSKVRTR